MRAEESLCSFSQAKKLKELGMVQNSHFMYVVFKVKCDAPDTPGEGGRFIDQKALVGDFNLDGTLTLISALDSELLKESIYNGLNLEDFDSKETYAAISGSEIGIVVPSISKMVVYRSFNGTWTDKCTAAIYYNETLARAQVLIDDLEHETYGLTSIEQLNNMLTPSS